MIAERSLLKDRFARLARTARIALRIPCIGVQPLLQAVIFIVKEMGHGRQTTMLVMSMTMQGRCDEPLVIRAAGGMARFATSAGRQYTGCQSAWGRCQGNIDQPPSIGAVKTRARCSDRRRWITILMSWLGITEDSSSTDNQSRRHSQSVRFACLASAY